jgi:lysophospholipase L1-like esterase
MGRLILILALISTQAMAQKITLTEPVRFLALGDSYTIGEGVSARFRWPTQFVDSMQHRGIDCLEPRIIAATGWRTDNLKNAIRKSKFKEQYNLVSLLIGVNNFYQQKPLQAYKVEFEELLLTAIRLAGDEPSQVFVLSIPDYGYTPFGKDKQETITRGIDEYNAANKAIAIKLGVAYYSITDISRRGLDEPDLVTTDGLHPSGKMYSAWVQHILDNMLGPAPGKY